LLYWKYIIMHFTHLNTHKEITLSHKRFADHYVLSSEMPRECCRLEHFVVNNVTKYHNIIMQVF
jgi:hypothetical protein